MKPIATTFGEVLEAIGKLPTMKPKKPVVVAMPPERCDLCHGILKSGPVFYDASLPSYGGTWGWCCEQCAKRSGVRLGTGLGQKYDSVTNEKLEG